MRVIKHGNKFLYKEQPHTCAYCGCEFNFNVADVVSKTEYVLDLDRIASYLYVSCPECTKKYILDENLFHDYYEGQIDENSDG